MFLLNGNPLAVDTPFKDAEGNQYPSNWLRLSTAEDKARLGITEAPDVDMNFDNRFYWAKDLPKALEDKSEDNGSTTKGLKSVFTSQVKQSAGSILAQTDWMVIRKAERNVDIPASVVAYRASVVAKADELEAAIAVVKTVEELAALDMSFPSEV
jgi:hypothetical protein